MAKPSKQIMDFMEKFGVDSDEIWEVHGSTWVVKHKALERVAAEQNITWERPAMLECNSADGVAALCVFGKMGERMEWSIGECLVVRPDRLGGNYKVTGKQAGYVYAMAEKRAKDRVILKLLNGGALYSEAEADDFTQRQNPHVTRADDILPPADPNNRFEDGAPPENQLTVAAQRPIFAALQQEIHKTGSVAELKAWKAKQDVRDRVAMIKPDWRDMLERTYGEHKEALLTQEQGDKQRDMRMAG